MRLFVLLLLLLAAPLRAAGLPDPVAFFNAVERGDVPQATEWLDAGLPPDFEGHMVGSGLMIAAWEGNVPMMALFHRRGADVNRTNRLGETALLHAAWKGHLPAVRWLVERGARVNRQGREWSALHYAAFAGHEAVVSYLLAQGADVNGLSPNGSTPLMMAAREGKEGIAKALLAAGARRDIVNERGDTAVHFAMRNNNVLIARDVAGSENFPTVAARPPEYWGRPVRSQRAPDRADLLLAQAHKLEAAGMREAALRTYRAALDAIRKSEAQKAAANGGAAPRAVTGLVITARRGDAGVQSAGLQYATPAVGIEKVGAGETASAERSAKAADAAEDWLQKGRELEAAGRRAEALQAYRQASAALRSGR